MRKEADKDVLKTGERVGNVIGAVFTVIVVLIFLYIQDRGYLFMDDFDATAQVLFYGAILYGMVPSLARAIIGRRNLGRLLDLVGSAIFVIVASYFLATFPFDFSNLYQALPSDLEWTLRWLTNSLVRVLLVIGIFITVISAAYNFILYLAVRDELSLRGMAPGPVQ